MRISCQLDHIVSIWDSLDTGGILVKESKMAAVPLDWLEERYTGDLLCDAASASSSSS